MSVSTTYEAATLYGALDSTAATDGDSLSAHVLRELAKSHNRMQTKACPWINLVWPLTSTLAPIETSPAVPPGLCVVYAFGGWTQILYPALAPKMPGHHLADAKIYLRAESGPTAYITIGTNARPLDDARQITSSLVASCAGDATWRTITISDIPVSRGDFEEASVFLRAGVTDIAGSTADFGSPNSWTVASSFGRLTHHYVLGPSSETWNYNTGVGNSWAEGGHILKIVNAGGADLVTPRLITDVRDIYASGAAALEFVPHLSDPELQTILSQAVTYEIDKTQRVSIGGVAIITRGV